MTKKKIEKCSLKKPNGRKCTNQVYKKKLCKLHYDSQEERVSLEKIKPEPFGIYADGLLINEQEQYYDVKVGTLESEIRVAKLLLNRLIKEKFDQELKNRGINAIPIKRTKLTDVVLDKDMNPVIGKTKDGDNAFLSDSEIISEAIDYDHKINRLFDVIRKLEVANFEIQGGIHSDPLQTAKQIIAFIKQIDDDAFGD